MKRKNKIWLIVCLIVTFIVPAGLMIIFPIILDKSWKSVWITGIIESLGWLIFGIIKLVQLSSKTELVSKIVTREIIDFHIDRLKDDEYLADNFIKDKSYTGNFGNPNEGVTPVLVIEGHMTEKERNWVVIVNLNNPKEQFNDIPNPSKKEIEELRELIADHPDKTIKEDIKFLNAFGNEFGNMSRTLPSSQRERDKIEEKKVEEKNAV